MALNTIPLPFGIRDIKLTPYTDMTATVLAGSSVDLPNARTLDFAETEDFSELRGDDSLVATHGRGPQVAWSLEGGGYSHEAVQTLYGGTITTTGVSPNQKKELVKLDSDQRPYFKVEGQSYSDSGGDFHVVIYRAKCTDDLKGTQTDGEFFLTGASGVGMKSLVASTLGRVWSIVQNETAVAIP